jgi:hypothetical protein
MSKKTKITLNTVEKNTLLVSLDHLQEHLQDLRGGFGDDLEVEIYNLERLITVNKIKEKLTCKNT